MTPDEAASGHGQRATGAGRAGGRLSVATEVKLPQLGQGMESGTIVRWLKAVGDPVKARDPLYELDTDKVTQEVEAEVDGVLLQILVPEGEVEVGRTIAVIGEGGEAAAVDGGAAPVPTAAPPMPETEQPAEPERAPEPDAEQAPVAEQPAAGATPPPTTALQPVAAVAVGGRVKASPLARRIARERGVDLASVVGTGPDGRILAEDVEQAAAGVAPAAPAPTTEAAAATAPAAPAVVALAEGEIEVVKLSSTRRTIARRLTEAWTAPVFQLAVSADATEIVALRERLVERLAEGEVKPTVNDVLVRLTATALVRHPALNALYANEEIHRYPSANIGIAAAAPAGLVVPVIRGADRLTIQEIARARADVVRRAREGKLTLPDLEGGTFTISNLGMYGIEQFVAVLNPPQVAILAVGAVKDTPVVVEGEIDVAPMMTMTLTCDHRAIDGSEGAEFLRTLVALVEEPALAL
jgi:pyruvate dehydrogenase E2 component (dihydrolipoamide acetyltransferase)